MQAFGLQEGGCEEGRNNEVSEAPSDSSKSDRFEGPDLARLNEGIQHAGHVPDSQAGQAEKGDVELGFGGGEEHKNAEHDLERGEPKEEEPGAAGSAHIELAETGHQATEHASQPGSNG